MKVNAKKSLGQNFLQDQTVINKIVNSNLINKEDLIIEIGPGKGALTKQLKKFDSYLLCYEIDQRMMSILSSFEDNKTRIIYNDFLKANIEDDIKNIKYNNLYIIGNLPYYITTPIIEKIIESNIDAESITIMVQNEVAERFCAKPKSKNYGRITVYLNYYFDIELICLVDKSAFSPIPKVDSAVVKFKRKDKIYNLNNKKVFFKLIEDSFKQKRKILRNNLSNYPWNTILSVLEANGYNGSVRAEEINIETFIAISNLLSKKPNK